MSRFFNAMGPCNPQEHYMLSALDRCKAIMPLIEQRSYFIIHAARQSGKTTLLKSLAQELNQGDQYQAIYCSLEHLRMVDDPRIGIPSIVYALYYQLNSYLNLKLKKSSSLKDEDPLMALMEALRELSQTSPKPLILLFDEVDCLRNDLLLSFLSQLRNGYVNRSTIPFPHSVALVGMRNIRDYKANVRSERETLGSSSPFNIISEALTLKNFTLEEVRALYQQHTDATKQVFEAGVVERVHERSCGQPWLVNAIARETIQKILEFDHTKPVKLPMVDQAIQNIILRRDTHIDSLLERLKEPRVRKIIEPVITGEKRQFDSIDDDFRYVIDLGLLVDDEKGLRPSNPIYAEVIVRALSLLAQERMKDLQVELPLSRYREEGKINFSRVLADFQVFWRENGEMIHEGSSYTEAVPHLVLQAYLQRLVNGGGKINREYAAGRNRLDLLIEIESERYPIEVKLDRGPKTYGEARGQLSKYLDQVGEQEGWVVIFDRKSDKLWNEKIYWKEETVDGKKLNFVGC